MLQGIAKITNSAWAMWSLVDMNDRFCRSIASDTVFMKKSSKFLWKKCIKNTGKVKWSFRVSGKANSNTWLKIHESPGQLDAAVS